MRRDISSHYQLFSRLDTCRIEYRKIEIAIHIDRQDVRKRLGGIFFTSTLIVLAAQPVSRKTADNRASNVFMIEGLKLPGEIILFFDDYRVRNFSPPYPFLSFRLVSTGC
jgi:hypothetical protein